MVSPHVPTLEGAQVAALINPDSMTWNQNMLQQHFLSFEADRIKTIPLCWTVQSDRLLWPFCGNGEYSVKTGYKLLCEDEDLVPRLARTGWSRLFFGNAFGDYGYQIK